MIAKIVNIIDLKKNQVFPEITHIILRVEYGKIRVEYGSNTGCKLPILFYGLKEKKQSKRVELPGIFMIRVNTGWKDQIWTCLDYKPIC